MRKCPRGEFTGVRQRSDTPLSSWLFDRSEVTGTLRHVVFISLSVARLRGNPGRRSPLSGESACLVGERGEMLSFLPSR